MSKKNDKPTLKMCDETVRLISNGHRSFYVNRDVAAVSITIDNQLRSEFKESQTKEIEIDVVGDILER
eukprot:CAMPEP_0168348340 /NCGR_PEP_ID=MMETSP0213-20121227/19651_1 /TAXON_ID=151035 /ORGANISM="Euplotes harpa, Strain FSP1.4" /LENGTH=67 /DNA_ID=CAMNT_0008357849 /DNA_START=22 /DNA_END=225 /DNA_ORIENTATION=-